MKNRTQGFTMIELIIVIVILGVLAATALPKFIDLNGEAKTAALQGVAGAAASAMTINYSACAVAQHTPALGKCVKVDNCNKLGNIMQGGLPTGYSVAAAGLGTGNAGSNGVEGTCTITQTISGATATADITGISAGNGP